MQVVFELVSRHKFSIQLIMLRILIYIKIGCGLRTTIDILGIFEEVPDESFKRSLVINP